ncbi:hypothetical protein MTO96_039938 [Rhipicephalus appendiculatus]
MQLPLRGSVFCPYFIAIAVSSVIAFPSLKEPQAQKDDCQRIWPRLLSSRLTPCYYTCIIPTRSAGIYTLVRREPDGTDCWAPHRGICLNGICHINEPSASRNFLQEHRLRDSLRPRRFKRSLGSFFRKLKAKGKSELGALREHFTLVKEQQDRQGESLKEKVTQATATLGEFFKDRLLHVPSHVKTAVHHNESATEGMTTGGLGKASEEVD